LPGGRNWIRTSDPSLVDGDAIEPLRREIREGLLTFLQRNYPEALPGAQARRPPA